MSYARGCTLSYGYIRSCETIVSWLLTADYRPERFYGFPALQKTVRQF